MTGKEVMKKQLLVLLVGTVLSASSFGEDKILEKRPMGYGECSQVHLENVASFGGAVQMRYLVLRMDALVVRYCTDSDDGSTILFSCMGGYMQSAVSSERGECP